MLLKGRTESDELLALRILNTRMKLTEKEKFHYFNLEKGYEGELKFDLMAESLQEERYIINDLLLEVNNSYFQIDTILISQGVIHILDIKNYLGDFYLESNKLYSVKTGSEWKNPITQLQRCATLFRQLLHNHKLNYILEATVIFINPEFTLYQSPMDQPIIFPTQINRFLNDLNKIPSKLNDGHRQLGQKLLSLHQTKNPYTALPKYTYDQLQKGIYCTACKSFSISIKNYDFICKNCGGHEKVEQAILRNTKELKLLFPNQKLTSQIVHDWCQVDLRKKTITRILKKNYTAIGNTSNTYYE